jgi:hypothetical protein
MKAKSLVWFNLLALIATLLINYLSNSLPLNGKTPGQLSDELPNLFVPAGKTFAIWGVIYFWLIIFNIWQFSALKNKKTAQIIEKIGLGFIITCLFNIAWIFAWHWQFLILSVGVMIGLFLSLIRLNLRLKYNSEKISSTEQWIVHAPFGIYWGWISVALIANITASLIGLGWRSSESDFIIASAMILVGALIAMYVVYTQNNIFYGLAVCWALYGIYSKRVMVSTDESQQISWVVLSCLFVLFTIACLRLQKWLKSS